MTTKHVVTDDQLGKVSRRLWEFQRRFMEGSLDPDLVAHNLQATIEGVRADMTNRYADEEVQSNYTYPEEYKGPRPIEEQIKAIAEIFSLDSAQALEYAGNLPDLPSGAEGWFAIPSDEGLQKLFPQIEGDAERYCAGVRLVHEKLMYSRKFCNYRDGQVTPNRLRVHARTAQSLATLAESQPGDILVIAAQLGMRHRGRSVRRAREVFVPGEYGLGSLAAGSITLTHPERFVRWEQLHMDCPGDEFSARAVNVFSCAAPYFSFVNDKVGWRAYGVGLAYGNSGSASGFLSQ